MFSTELQVNHSSENLIFNFTTRPLKEWNQLYEQIPQANWFQSWPFATARFTVDQIPSRLATLEIKNKIVGLVLLQEIQLGPIRSIEINRGPLWLKAQATLENFELFCKAFNSLYPKSFMNRRRWLIDPMNGVSSEEQLQILNRYGFEKSQGSFETQCLNLEKSEGDLFSDLQPKWRNSLRKANRLVEDHKISIISSEGLTDTGLEQFCNGYELHRKNKNYKGVSSRFLKAEIKEAQLSRQALTVFAFHQQKVIAGQYFLLQGQSSSYRFGWSLPLGRQYMCHYSMIWKSALQMKRMGLKNFDLGGLLLNESKGLAHFKLGLSGQTIESLGIFK